MKGLTAPKTELALLGHIRLGSEKVEEFSQRLKRNVLTRGKPLDYFRLTCPSAHRLILEEVCELYGSDEGVQPWTDADGRPALQAVLKSNQLEVGIPTDEDPVSAYYETWAGGYCTSRCNLDQRQVPVGEGKFAHWEVKPCTCDPEDPEACTRVVRLSVTILGIHADGRWLLATGANYAYTHWDGAVKRCQQYALPGRDAPALLAIVSRTSKNKGRADPVRQYKVCEIIPVRPQTRQDLLGAGPEVLQLPVGMTDSAEGGEAPPPPETSAELAAAANDIEGEATVTDEDAVAGMDVQESPPSPSISEGVQPGAASGVQEGTASTEEPPPLAAAQSSSLPAWASLNYKTAMEDTGKHFKELTAFQKAIKGLGTLPEAADEMTLGAIVAAMSGGAPEPVKTVTQTVGAAS